MVFRKTDILAIALVVVMAVLVALLFLPGKTPGGQVQIYRDGRLIQTLSLQKDQQVRVSGAYENTVTVRDGKVAVTASDCPGEDCVGCGWIEVAGRSIVCLPNGVEVRVVEATGDVDMVVG